MASSSEIVKAIDLCHIIGASLALCSRNGLFTPIIESDMRRTGIVSKDRRPVVGTGRWKRVSEYSVLNR